MRLGVILLLRVHFGISGDTFNYYKVKVACFIWWVEAKHADHHSTMHKIVPRKRITWFILAILSFEKFRPPFGKTCDICLLELAYFTKHNAFQLYLLCCKRGFHSFLWLSCIPLCIYTSYFVYPINS